MAAVCDSSCFSVYWIFQLQVASTLLYKCECVKIYISSFRLGNFTSAIAE